MTDHRTKYVVKSLKKKMIFTLAKKWQYLPDVHDKIIGIISEHLPENKNLI